MSNTQILAKKYLYLYLAKFSQIVILLNKTCFYYEETSAPRSDRRCWDICYRSNVRTFDVCLVKKNS